MDKDLEAAGAAPTLRPPSTALRGVSFPPPPPPPKDERYRPNTASTKRLSYSTTVSTSQRTIKYATRGKFAGTELSPQPSDDPEDPLNWPQWKKELNYVSLMVFVALVSGMKTVFISVNNVMARRYQVSYSAVVALTAVPLILSAFTGLASITAAKVWGKRPVYLASMALVFIGSMWNMRTLDSYRECMAARVFQGLGWGAFDTLILGSIYDTFFEHERGLRISIYNLITVAVTWGAPLFGGLASRNAGRFTLQFEIINSFLAVAVPLLIFGAAESTFDHVWSVSLQTPASAISQFQRPLIPRGPLKITKEDVLSYLKTIPPASYKGNLETHTLLQAPRAFVAPTTILLFAVTLLPYGSLWAMAETVSLLFTTEPFALREDSISSLMGGPFMIMIILVSLVTYYKPYQAQFDKRKHFITLIAGTSLFMSGLLSFGLVTTPNLLSQASGFNYPLLAFLLALLAAGFSALDATVSPLIFHSSQFTSSNLYTCLRNVADMSAGVGCLRTLFTGILVQAIPSAVEASRGALARHAVALACTQVLLAGAAGTVWWIWGDRVRRWDGRVMGLVDLSMLRRNESFFEYDD
ncbi:hypothetical protein jhhlp_005980 [Lomentospora prolificans]|uniref:Major facilitator superfamily (MFS) profile domain-containing protein n=1 Tax=Lomentospora prolificans TaxID=41688 RepID=A0A2N3N4M7_9PEZI|nr:hypothetical protein jhhlp_005980 [Lomentospora prolificans]